MEWLLYVKSRRANSIFCALLLSNFWVFVYYRPQRSCGQGNVFIRVCDSVHRGVCLSACWETPQKGDPPEGDPPGRRHPPEGGTPGKETPWKKTPLPQEGDFPEGGTPLEGDPTGKETAPRRRHPPERRPPRRRTPPEGGTPPGIRSMSGRYASYWNALLFLFIFFHVRIVQTNVSIR